MDLIEKKLAGKSGGDILDIATQAGDFITQLKDVFKDYNKAVGIDISDDDFEKGRETFKDDPVFRARQTPRLPERNYSIQFLHQTNVESYSHPSVYE